jgi:hypothetical protein
VGSPRDQGARHYTLDELLPKFFKFFSMIHFNWPSIRVPKIMLCEDGVPSIWFIYICDKVSCCWEQPQEHWELGEHNWKHMRTDWEHDGNKSIKKFHPQLTPPPFYKAHHTYLIVCSILMLNMCHGCWFCAQVITSPILFCHLLQTSSTRNGQWLKESSRHCPIFVQIDKQTPCLLLYIRFSSGFEPRS